MPVPYLLDLLYLLLLILTAPYWFWQAWSKGKYRSGRGEKLLGRAPVRSGEGTCLWFHAVSVGEVNLLAPLLAEITQRRPSWTCVISTTTATGMALARRKYAGYTVFYCPLDFSWATTAAVRRIRPDVLVLAELELWPNLIRAARQGGAAVAVINGRLSENSYRGYARARWFFARLLRQIDRIAVQDAQYRARFEALGAPPDRLVVTGSMKYDGAQTDRNNPQSRRLATLAGFAEDDIVLLAGSTQEPEEAIALDVFRTLCPQWPRLRLVVVPRHPERFEAVGRLLEQSGAAWQRRSKLEEQGPRPEARILLVDTIGELGAWWGTAQIAFVGGSMGNRGGQNMIEPAAYGAAVCFGPNTRNFRDIVSALLAAEAAEVVADRHALLAFVRRCLAEPDYAARLGQNAQQLVVSQQGATAATFAAIEALVERPKPTTCGSQRIGP